MNRRDGQTRQPSAVVRLRLGRLSLSAGAASSVIGNLIALPVAYRSLGVEAFGVWATVLAAVAMAGPLDLGVGNWLTQSIAQSPLDDVDRLASLIRRAVVSVCAIALVLLAGASLVIAAVGGHKLAGVPSGVPATEAIGLGVLAAAAGLPLGLVDRIHLGLEESHRNGLISVSMSAVTLGGIVIAAATGRGLLTFVSAVVFAGPAVRSIAWLLLLRRRSLSKALLRSGEGPIRSLLTHSMWFGLLQFIATASYNADQLVIAWVAGPREVAVYAVPARLFGLLVVAVNVLVTPMWPMLARRWSDEETEWDMGGAARVVGRLATATLGVGFVFGLGLIVLGPALLESWMGGEYQHDGSTLLAFAVWSAVYGVATPLGFALIAFGAVRAQVVPSALALLLNVGASVLLVGAHGAAGAVWASVGAFILVVIPVDVWLLRRQLRDRGSAASPPGSADRHLLDRG